MRACPGYLDVWVVLRDTTAFTVALEDTTLVLALDDTTLILALGDTLSRFVAADLVGGRHE